MCTKNDKYIKFFEEIKKFKLEQSKQKQRGLNNYNILTTVLKAHDEVRLHSRMIASLLDIGGTHYQDTLFLNEFLNILKIKDYDSQNSKIFLEYKNIDLYLTDGVTHVIIENKIWAGDQKAQIERYVDIIKRENGNIELNNLYVIYLSLDRDKPSIISLGKLRIDDDFIYDDENKIAHYKALHYKKHILKWLNKCQFEIQNITNLNEAIKQYIDVIKILNNDYKGKIKTMKDEILLKDENLKLVIQEILPALIESKIDIQVKFWNELKNELLNLGYEFQFVDGHFNNIDINQKCIDYYKNSQNNKYYGLKLDLKNIGENNTLSFYIEIDWNIYYGFTLSEDSTRKEIASNGNFTVLSQEIINMNYKWSSTNNDPSQKWWICWKYPNKKLSFKSFSSDNIFNLVNELTNDDISNRSIKEIGIEIDTILQEYNKKMQ